MLELDPSALESLILDGLEVPLADLTDLDVAPARLRLGGKVYQYIKSYPAKGYTAVAPYDIGPLLAQGKEVLLVNRGERYYLYQG